MYQYSTLTFHGTRPNSNFEEMWTSNTHSSYMITEFCTRPKHDFTPLGWVDGWLGRTLVYDQIHIPQTFVLTASDYAKSFHNWPSKNEIQTHYKYNSCSSITSMLHICSWIRTLHILSPNRTRYWLSLESLKSDLISIGIILGMDSANERRHYYVMPPLIGWAHTLNLNDLCSIFATAADVYDLCNTVLCNIGPYYNGTYEYTFSFHTSRFVLGFALWHFIWRTVLKG